jgi:hypothetical protein
MTIYWWQNSHNGLKHLQRCSACNPAKLFFTSKFNYLIFCNPTHKTETGIANRWGTTNSEPPAPIIMIGQSKTLSGSHIIFITLFCAGAHPCCAFYQPQQILQCCWAKTGFLSETGRFWLLFIEFYCARSHTEHRWRCTRNFGFADPNH